MTDIKTLSQPEKKAKVEVALETEFTMIESFKPADLRVWLDRLPDNTRVKFVGVHSGKICLRATWKEMR